MILAAMRMGDIEIFDGGKLFEVNTRLNMDECAKLLTGEKLTFNYTDESGIIEVTIRIIKAGE